METTFQKISRKTGRKPVECKCQACQMQCLTCPCLGTPEDIERLIDAGYREKLALTDWYVGMMMGVIGHPVPMVQALQTETGCIFLQNGLCELHNKGLKPTEGRLSHHSTRLDNFKPHKSISWNVAKEWIRPENESIIRRIIDKMTIKTDNQKVIE